MFTINIILHVKGIAVKYTCKQDFSNGSKLVDLDVFYEAPPNTKLVERSAIALGFFDGVHPGHKLVISKAVEEARAKGVKAGVVTFKDHPRTLTRGQSPLLLTVIEQRLELFKELGVDVALVLAFTEELCRLSPRQYVENVLIESMGACSISVGHNHHFGKDAEGDANLLKKIGQEKEHIFSVHSAPMLEFKGREVSSSRIRDEITLGKVKGAEEILGRPFALLARVVRGDGRGRQIGFPTANLETYLYQVLPKNGVYAGSAILEDGTKNSCVINVGFRPTFKDPALEARPLVEAHLLEFDKDIYGENMELQFFEQLRDEKKFSSVDELKSQINKDIELAKSKITSRKETKSHASNSSFSHAT